MRFDPLSSPGRPALQTLGNASGTSNLKLTSAHLSAVTETSLKPRCGRAWYASPRGLRTARETRGPEKCFERASMMAYRMLLTKMISAIYMWYRDADMMPPELPYGIMPVLRWQLQTQHAAVWWALDDRPQLCSLPFRIAVGLIVQVCRFWLGDLSHWIARRLRGVSMLHSSGTREMVGERGIQPAWSQKMGWPWVGLLSRRGWSILSSFSFLHVTHGRRAGNRSTTNIGRLRDLRLRREIKRARETETCH